MYKIYGEGCSEGGDVVSRFECEAILFDLDGVLVDSAASVERATRIWLSVTA
jgi:hypothetical protein